MPAYLIDEDSSEQHTVTEPLCKIGSNPAGNIVLQYDNVEPNHVRIELRNGVYYAMLEPGAPSTRKWLFFFDFPTAKHNGAPLIGRATKLADGDKLLVGSRLFQFRSVA